MTPPELKRHVQARGSHFFDRDSLKFFGDTMRNYGVCRDEIVDHSDQPVPCWQLYRRRPVKHVLKTSAYFAMDDYRQVYPKK